MRFTATLLCAASLLTIVGCGKSSYQKNAEYAEEMIAVMNDYAEALESVKDTESAKAAASKIDAATTRMEELLAKKDSIPKVTQSDKDRLDKEYNPKLRAASERMKKAAETAGSKAGLEPTFMKAVVRMMKVAQSAQGK